MREAAELSSPTEEYHAQPLSDNLFEWHFTLRGPPNTDFAGGVYHGRITLPPDYPMKPPSIIMLTPNGRFEVNKKICLSISGHHPESWQPSWSIRTALLALIGFMPTHGNGAIGSLDYTPGERQQLAVKSRDWKCADCGDVNKVFEKDLTESSDEVQTDKKMYEDVCSADEVGLSNDVAELLCEPEQFACQNVEQEASAQLQTNVPIRRRTVSFAHDGAALFCRHNSGPSFTSETGSTPSFWSLVLMWVIALIFVVLFVRRLFY
ncbi:ubiquitin-conjugating enzyme E2 J1-like isoform X2 [Stegodyphus dumicola]|nr:ubiquitin-conjugating enzyme E2 J1-like isoform X2 [Stegodyphus dumicola]